MNFTDLENAMECLGLLSVLIGSFVDQIRSHTTTSTDTDQAGRE